MTKSLSLRAIAKSKQVAYQVAKSVSLDELVRAINNLESSAKILKSHEANKAAKARAANLKKLKSIMDEMGLSAADVKSLGGAKAIKRPGRPKKAAAKRKASAKKGPKKGTKVAPKYQLKAGKELHKWTGRGRMPLVFKEFIQKGGSLEKCLIKK